MIAMLYVCDLWIEKDGSHYVQPYGHFFLEFKHYPTSQELYEELIGKFCVQMHGVKNGGTTGSTFKRGSGRDYFCSGISACVTKDGETIQYFINATNLRALPKVRNKEKYLKNGKE